MKNFIKFLENSALVLVISMVVVVSIATVNALNPKASVKNESNPNIAGISSIPLVGLEDTNVSDFAESKLTKISTNEYDYNVYLPYIKKSPLTFENVLSAVNAESFARNIFVTNITGDYGDQQYKVFIISNSGSTQGKVEISDQAKFEIAGLDRTNFGLEISSNININFPIEMKIRLRIE